MTPLAQSNLEHGHIVSSKSEHVESPVDHVEHIQQGSMAPPAAISTDQLIDPNMSLDPEFLVPIEETVGSDPNQTTHLSNKDIDPSLVLPSTEDNRTHWTLILNFLTLLVVQINLKIFLMLVWQKVYRHFYY